MKAFSHERVQSGKEEWLTPPYIIKALGEFDLDPCSPVNRPWDTAKEHYTIKDNGLIKPWHGRIWLNPPYGNKTALWLRKMASHKNGIALIFARTETRMFHEDIFNLANAIFFFKGRLYFYHCSGEIARWNGCAPSCLVAYGKENARALRESKLPGKFIKL